MSAAGWLAVEYLARSILLLASAALLAWVLRRRSAAIVAAVWHAALGGVVALLVLSVVAPHVRVTLPTRAAGALERLERAAAPAGTAAITTPTAAPAVLPEADGAAPSVPAVVGALWMAGAIVLLLRGAARNRSLRRFGERLQPAPRAMAERAARIGAELGVRREVRLLTGNAVATPLAWGVRRARIALPPEASGWPEQQLDAVLAHELAHVARGDGIGERLAGVACAVCWMNPLVWLARHRLRVERERACDDAALGRGADPDEYAASLLDIARRAASRSVPAAAIAMARRSELSIRLLLVLDPHRQRSPLTPRARRHLATWAAVAVGTIAMVTPSPSAAGDQVESVAGAAVAPVASNVVAPAAGNPEPPAPARTAASPPRNTTASCWDYDGPGRNLNRNTEDGVRTAEWRTPICTAAVRITGRFGVAPDSARLVAGSPGAVLAVLEERGTHWERIIVSGRGGALTARLTIDGVAADPRDADRWLAANLRAILRRTQLPLHRIE